MQTEKCIREPSFVGVLAKIGANEERKLRCNVDVTYY